MERSPLLLIEAAKGVRDLPEGYRVGVGRDEYGEWTIYYMHGHEYAGEERAGLKLWGSITIEETGWPCSGGFQISLSQAKRGWGPLIYDVAMEWASRKGRGLFSDREIVSDSAEKVWRYYNTRRKDVRKYQLDDTMNALTPNFDDNCAQGSARELASPWHSKENPLSKLYVKKPARVMANLKKQGKLVFADPIVK